MQVDEKIQQYDMIIQSPGSFFSLNGDVKHALCTSMAGVRPLGPQWAQPAA